MSAPVTASPSLTNPAPDAGGSGRDSAPEIDASCRWPVLLLLLGALAWLIPAVVLALLGTVKLHAPGLLADTAWLTVGRVRPAAMNLLLYGFASPAALGVLLWMLARLGGARMLFQVPVGMAGLLWHGGVALGVAGILAGDSTGFDWLEMPRYATPILFVSFLVIALCALANFCHRRPTELYASVWYLLAALFCFAWFHSAASYLLVFDPVRGVLQAAVNAWFTNGLLGLWLTPVGIAVVFYLLPKLTGRPLHNYWLAVFGFWTLLLFTNWSGTAQLAGSPLPRWILSVGAAANLLLLVPLVAVGLNWHLTVASHYRNARGDAVLRFVFFGAACYLVAGIAGVLAGMPPLLPASQLSFFPLARTQLALLGFVAMILFAAMYHILPRILRAEWPQPRLIEFHFWASAAGIVLVVLPLAIGGLVQGTRAADPAVDFVRLARSMNPFIGNASLGTLVFLLGQGAFVWHVVLLLRRHGAACCSWSELCASLEAENAGGPS
jgi:cytochrome c oxidase cbb3-type subunit I